jgi:hypothetical protein
MMGIFSKKSTILFVLFFATVSAATAQQLKAVNDTLRTGPLQTVRKNIVHNDTIPGDTYSWKIITSPLPACGTFRKDGDYLEFTPKATCRNTSFDIQYELSGSESSVTAIIHVIVSYYNNPANIIDSDVTCYNKMSTSKFGIRKKYEISPKASPSNWIDAFVSPVVGDLNGDGKPEIVIMGNYADYGATSYTYLRYINIYNGQTGERMYQYDFTLNGYKLMSMGGAWHRPPSSLALADLDNDGTGEIVFTHANSGRVAAFKPVFNGSAIVNMKKMWEGNINGATVNYKSPITSSDDDIYGYPHPYVADLNGDGTPEVIVYNKIFNGATGSLLMVWQDEAPQSNPKKSNYYSRRGLKEINFNFPVSKNGFNGIKNAAMTGRRPGSGGWSDRYLSVPAVIDIDGDGQQEIVTGNRIHKFQFNSLTDHTKNTYYTVEGPQSAEVSERNSKVTYWLNDGFTRVADVDGDGQLDIVVACFGNDGDTDVKIIVYVWDMNDLRNVKACVSMYSDVNAGSFSIPFIGDINGEKDGWDGSGWTRKLPEICILGGGMYIDCSEFSSESIGRTGVKFHPGTDNVIRRGVKDNNDRNARNRRFNRVPNNGQGHIIGLTWDASATAIEEKLKVSWGMEHKDISNNTGITLFDFDNNNAADLCYRDEWTLSVISPAKSGRDYVELSEDENTANTSIMFKTDVYSGTAFEYPVIADVNMDGSADIVVTNIGYYSRDVSRGWVEVYEYQGEKWAPCPPVWNQGMYDPAQVREDLKINACPIPVLTKFAKDNGYVQPYNGSWIQVPIVKDGAEFTPIVRMPDASIVNMTVSVKNASLTEVTLTIRNEGSATISAQMPIAFYSGGTSGYAIEDGASLIESQPVGVDIFPTEKVTRKYRLKGKNYNNYLILARITDDGINFPAAGYHECDLSDNSFAGSDCPLFSVLVDADPATVLCGNGTVTLTAVTSHCYDTDTKTYQWYRYDNIISGATSSTHVDARAGEYRCYVTCGHVCRTFSSTVTITRSNLPGAQIEGNPVLKYNPFTDSLHITVKVKNTGKSDFHTPFKTTVYKNGKGNAVKYTHSYQNVIATGKTVEIPFGIPNFKTAWYGNSYTGLFLNTNDNGNTYNDQSVCNSANRSMTVGRVMAVDDYVTVFYNSMDNRMSVVKNDFLTCPLKNTKVTAVRNPGNGSCIIRGDTVIYTPKADYTGRDTIAYTVTCDGSIVSTANVYIAVQDRPNITGDADRVVCPGSAQEIVGTYVTNCSFGDSVIYRWEFRPVSSSNWQTLEHDTVILDCSKNRANITIERKLHISSTSASDDGYYRIWMNYPASVAGVTCCTVSDSISIQIAKEFRAPDVRIDISPSPSRKIRLTSFLDTLDNTVVKWEKVSPFAPDINSVTGEINTSKINLKSVYTYRYSMTSTCFSSSAIVYICVLNNKLIHRLDTMVICKDHIQSKSIQLNQILGAEFGGKMEYNNTVNPDDKVANNVKTFSVSSNYHGALIFNAYQAWIDATDSRYRINYKGDANAKIFKFRYTAAAENYTGTKEKTFVIVVTDK